MCARGRPGLNERIKHEIDRLLGSSLQASAEDKPVVATVGATRAHALVATYGGALTHCRLLRDASVATAAVAAELRQLAPARHLARRLDRVQGAWDVSRVGVRREFRLTRVVAAAALHRASLGKTCT